MSLHVLLAVDDSPASPRVAEYVGRMLRVHPAGRRSEDGSRVSILHCFLRQPLVEYATSVALAADIRRPAYEGRLERDHDVAVQMVELTRCTDLAREILVESGVPRAAIGVRHVDCGPSSDVSGAIVDMARRLECCTIAVGRNVDNRLLRAHVSDGVIKRGTGLAVWVVQ